MRENGDRCGRAMKFPTSTSWQRTPRSVDRQAAPGVLAVQHLRIAHEIVVAFGGALLDVRGLPWPIGACRYRQDIIGIYWRHDGCRSRLVVCRTFTARSTVRLFDAGLVRLADILGLGARHIGFVHLDLWFKDGPRAIRRAGLLTAAARSMRGWIYIRPVNISTTNTITVRPNPPLGP